MKESKEGDNEEPTQQPASDGDTEITKLRNEHEALQERVRIMREALEDIQAHTHERSWSHVDYWQRADDALVEVELLEKPTP